MNYAMVILCSFIHDIFLIKNTNKLVSQIILLYCFQIRKNKNKKYIII